MKHNEPIQPTPTAEPIPTLPDRTDLSQLYPQAQKTTTPVDVDDAATLDSRPIIINKVIVSLLLFVPVLSMCLLVLYIHHNMSASFKNPLASLNNFYATGICLLFWALSFRSLARQFEKCNVSLSIFTTFYLFYLFPVLSLTSGLLQRGGSSAAVALAILLALTYFAVSYMTWALNRQASSYGNRMLMVALPIFILVIGASLF